MRRLTRLALSGASVIATLLVLGTPACAMQQAPDDATRVAAAELALEHGKYGDAVPSLTTLASSATGATLVRARRALLRALEETGRYDDAESRARSFGAGPPPTAEYDKLLGDALRARGRLAAADSAYARAIAQGSSDSLPALVAQGMLRLDAGDRAAAMRIFDRFIDIYNTRKAKLTARELFAVAAACRALGGEQPQLFKDALKAYDQAIARDTHDLDARVALGEMFLEKYNSADAKTTLAEVLAVNPSHPRALVAMARRAYFDGDTGATALAQRALAVNPALADAHVFLATIRLDAEDWPGATDQAKRALAIDPTSRAALASLAAAHYFGGDRAAFELTKGAALARNARDGDFFATLAGFSARNRYYRQAVEFAHQGAALDPKSWRSLGALGMNQLRTGQSDSARASLREAFKGDPYDVWVKNTLDLLDTYKDYTTLRTPRFEFLVDSKESALLSVYLGEIAEEAYDKLSARYGYSPKTPVKLEVYRSHADFSVRTTGLAGLGALGVSFGNILAMDSPGARKIGEFNWGSTFWHELTHAFTLGMTDHRVPRWFSEGLSVHEERRARTGWGATVTPGFLEAYAAGKLPPVSKLNDGFMHPTFPEEIFYVYYEASLVCEMIEQQYGLRALVEMLNGYKAGLSTPDVFQRALKTDLATFDSKFDQYVKTRFAKPIAAVGGAFPALSAQGRLLLERGKLDEAAAAFTRAKAEFPEYVGDDSPYWYLAEIARKQGALKSAEAELVTLTSSNESAYVPNLVLDSIAEQLGDTAVAAAALDRAMWISPYDIALHQRLAALAGATKDTKRAVRERRAVVALEPTDRAEALYQLALAYRAAGDAASAKREVLRALEAAPSFERAQELLLALRAPPGGKP
ncbi:MAG: tetratricopeptide repeat protein [Gemmatimonadaceae bacterium]